MDFNFTKKQQKDFDPLPEGEYPVEIENVELKRSRNNNKMWNITFNIMGGDYQDRKLWDNLAKTDKTDWKFQNFFCACGFEEEKAREGGYVHVSDSGEELIGKQLFVKVVQEERDGKTRNKIDRYIDKK